MDPDHRADNVENKMVARETNEWIRVTSQGFGLTDGPATYLCECSAPNCRSTVTVPRAAYELARGDGRQFVIRTNHENPELDCVISQRPTFAVVQMLPGPPSRIAVDNDPRLGAHKS
jgi:hypothetical protein